MFTELKQKRRLERIDKDIYVYYSQRDVCGRIRPDLRVGVYGTDNPEVKFDRFELTTGRESRRG